MDFIPENPILKFRTDTLDYIRRQYNLEKPGRIKESIDILREWVQKQNHFKKKDFSDRYYEVTITACKGSLERAKNQIDRICTMRTLLSHFFTDWNLKTELARATEAVWTILLPQLTDDHYRVELVKFNNVSIHFSQNLDFFKSTIVLAEYERAHDYVNGYVVVVDLIEANLVDFLANINPVYLKQAMSIYVEGYGMRIRSIHLVTTSKVLDAVIALVKQVMSPKVAGRVHIHKTMDEVYEFVPKHILPMDYGGEERSMKELYDDWFEELTSDEHIKHMQEINKAGTDENYRQRDKFNEQYAGMSGTFRLLSID